MGYEITDLTTLPSDRVEEEKQELITELQELNPTLDTRIGPLRAHLLNNNAILTTKNKEEVDRLRRSLSLKQIEEDPSLADNDTVDNIFSNYRVTRGQGNLAQGQITIVVTSNQTTTVGEGAIYEADGQQFQANSSFVAKSEPELINNTTDRLLEALQDGNFAFVIDVTAVDQGVAGNVRKDTPMAPQEPPLNFLKAFATDDFRLGADIETNQEMLTRLQEGLAAKAASNRVNMNAMLRETQWGDFLVTSIVGYGDAEQLRDAHTIFPLHFGGRVDWYIRRQDRVFRQAKVITATLIEKTTDGYGVWQFSLGRDVAPGFYEVGFIRPRTSGNFEGSFPIVADIRDNDLTGDLFIPDIMTVAEGEYTRYQTATLQFKDTLTATALLAIGDTQEYNIEIKQQPDIGEMHDFLSSRDIRNAAGDILVKAPVPCFVRLSFTIQQQVGVDEIIDEEGIKVALADTVNTIPFTGRLPASLLCETVHDFLVDQMSISAVDMLGRIREPGGETLWLRDTEVLTVPDKPQTMVTAKTVQFYLDPEDVTIAIESVGEPAL